MLTRPMILLIAMLVLMLLFLQYRLWFESGGIRDMWHLQKALTQQTLENERLKKHNDELLFQIRRLQNSQDAAESYARDELGMVKKDEKFYQIIK
jgi:cell division protein FtsB